MTPAVLRRPTGRPSDQCLTAHVGAATRARHGEPGAGFTSKKRGPLRALSSMLRSGAERARDYMCDVVSAAMESIGAGVVSVVVVVVVVVV